MTKSRILTGMFLCFLLTSLMTIMPSPVQAQAGVDRIYYVSNYYQVWSADLDGGNQTQLYVYPDFPIIDGIAVDLVNGYIYIAVEQQGPSYNINSIDRINLDGSGHVQLINLGGQFPLSVAYSPTENMVYWMEQSSPSQMRRMNIDGTGVQTVRDLTGLSLRDIEIDPLQGRIYWNVYNNGAGVDEIYYAPLGVGTTPQLLASGLGVNALEAIALNRATCTVYWTNRNGIIGQSHMVTGATSNVATGLGTNTRNIEIYHPTGLMYWTDLSTEDLRSANLDGTGQTTIIPASASVWDPFDVGTPAYPSMTAPAAIDLGTTSGASPGTPVNFTVNAADLLPANAAITITGSASVEVSTDGVTYGTTATLTAVGGSITGTNNVWARIAAGAPQGAVNTVITYSGGGLPAVNSDCDVQTQASGTVQQGITVQFNSATSSAAEAADIGNILLVTTDDGSPTATAVTISVAVNGGTATAADYTLTGTITIPAGTASGSTVSIASGIVIVDDNHIEADETIDLALSNPVNATLGPQVTHTHTILNDDVVQVAFSAANSAVSEAAGSANVEVQLTISGTAAGAGQLQNGAVTVEVVDAGGGSATSGTDYTAIGTQTLTFPANSGSGTTQSVAITIANDTIAEGDETVNLELQNPSGVVLGTQTTHQLTITDDDTAGVTVTETGGSTDVVEGGATDDFTIVLTSQPTAGTVTVQAVPDAQCEINGNGAGNPATFTFTSGNWNMSQTFTVAAIDDLVAEGPHTCTITNSISASGAPEYPTTLPVSAVTANITDNDAAGITVSPTSGLTVSEENITPATFTLTSSGEPTADVTVPVNGDANCEVSTDGVTYSASVNIVLPAGAAMPQTVYVQAVNDGVVDGDIACTITTGDPASTDAQYDALGAGDVDDVTATALDNDLDFALATAGGGVEGTGGTQTYTFTITPGGAIAHVGGTVDFAIGGTGVNGTDYNFVPAADISGSGVTAAGSTVTFAQNAGAATLTFNIITDSITEADFTIEVTLSNPTAGTAGTGSVSSSPLALTVTDDDVAGVAITQSGGATAVVEGDAAGDTYTVVLNTIPGSAVTITITPQAGCDLGAGDGVAITLIFNADAAALTPQTVTVTAPDNATADGNRACDLTHTAASADTNYNGAGVAFTVDAAPTNIVTVNITDDDTPAVLIDLVDGSVDTTEGGITDDYTVVLATVPTDQVTVTLTPDAQCDLGGGAGVAVNLTFEVATALDAQIVTVTAVDDVLTEGPHTCVITHASSSTDSAYNPASITVDGVTTNIVTVNITDNDVPGLTFSRVRVTEGGASRTYTIQLNTMPTADVEITAITPDAQCTISGVTLPLVFTTADWNTPQAVTVTAVDDNDDEGNHTCNVTHTISSADAVYGALGAEAHTVNVRDNDRDDPTVTPPPSTGGGDKPPTAQVDIGVFDPAISKIGFLLPGQVGVGGEQLEWVVTVSNNGSAPGTNIQVTDQIDSRLRINRVETPPQATAVVQRQTVTVTIPLLAPGEVVIFSIFTTVLQGASVENTACLTADDIAAQRCTTSVAVAGLPATGETPWWRTLLLVLLPGILAGGAAVSVVRRQRLKNRSG